MAHEQLERTGYVWVGGHNLAGQPFGHWEKADGDGESQSLFRPGEIFNLDGSVDFEAQIDEIMEEIRNNPNLSDRETAILFQDIQALQKEVTDRDAGVIIDDRITADQDILDRLEVLAEERFAPPPDLTRLTEAIEGFGRALPVNPFGDALRESITQKTQDAIARGGQDAVRDLQAEAASRGIVGTSLSDTEARIRLGSRSTQANTITDIERLQLDFNTKSNLARTEILGGLEGNLAGLQLAGDQGQFGLQTAANSQTSNILGLTSGIGNRDAALRLLGLGTPLDFQGFGVDLIGISQGQGQLDLARELAAANQSSFIDNLFQGLIGFGNANPGAQDFRGITNFISPFLTTGGGRP